ncbi:MAG: 30S ribosomal protein S6 [Candidatus Binatia bacterium]|nr:MAG: 30S ribosomal protein S6 [Candidatus Binatia bacterium]
MREYETLYVQHPEVPEARQQEMNARIRSLIESNGGEVSLTESWGLRELAYPIQKQKKGYYYLIRYRATPTVVNELDRNLKIFEEIIRFITVRIPEHIRKREGAVASSDADATRGKLTEESVYP